MKQPKIHYENCLATLNISDEMFTDDFLYEILDNIKKSNKFDKNAKTYLRGIYLMLYKFKSTGKKIFKFSNDLCLLLNKTSLKKVDTETLNVPYKTFYINGFDVLDIKTPEGALINCAYVDYEIIPPEEKAAACKHFKGQYDINLKENEPIYSIIFTFATEQIVNSDTIDQFILPFYYNKGNLLEIFRNHIKFYNSIYNAESQKFLLKLIRFILNCILYLTSDDALIERIKPKDFVGKKKSKKKIQKAVRHAGTNIPYNYVGRNIVIDRKDRNQYLNSNTRDNVKEYTGRWMMMGHWHSYWVNEIKDDHKVKYFDEGKNKYLIRKFIKPYFKGDGIVIDKQYIVK